MQREDYIRYFETIVLGFKISKKGWCPSGVEQAVGKHTSSQKWFWGDIVMAFVKSRKVYGGYQGTVYENPSFRIFWLYLFVKVVSSHSWFCKVFTTNRKGSRLEDSLPAGELRFKVAEMFQHSNPGKQKCGRGRGNSSAWQVEERRGSCEQSLGAVLCTF